MRRVVGYEPSQPDKHITSLPMLTLIATLSTALQCSLDTGSAGT